MRWSPPALTTRRGPAWPMALAAAALIGLGMMPLTIQACPRCQAGGDLEEAYRFMNEGRGGGGAFPLDSGLNAYAEMPAAPMPEHPAPTPRPMVAAALSVTSAPVPPAVPEVVATILLPAPAPVSPSPGGALASARWADFGLLGLLAAGGVFAWRTRRTTAAPTVTTA